jgi:alginate O-acetyltransferase complex protein AlgI
VSFVSLTFLVFFVAVMTGLALMRTRRSRQALLLVASFVFYASATPWFVIVLLVPSLVDYACAIRMEESVDRRERSRWLVLSLVTNLGILLYFKYSNFFVDNFASLFGVRTAPLAVVLPVGISFFTFKTMSYTIDVYRGQLRACRSLWQYTMFVSFFPELVAGPIVRASVFLPQLTRSLRLTWSNIAAGLQLILLGVTKKLLVADRLAVFVDPVFRQPGVFSGGTVLAAVVAYSLQIYCDFSGYTDIAIGVAKMTGFDLPENFNMPYLARSITDFWRRWHITLSQWLRDYLYIPLGGNRRGTVRTYVNLMLTMLLGGLWHGASWTFVVWGLLHGIGLATHKLWSRHRPEFLARSGAVGAVVGWSLTYAFVCLAWIFFRAPNFSTAALMIRKIIGQAPGGISWFFLPFWMLLPLVAAAHVIGSIRGRHAPTTTEATHDRRDGPRTSRPPFVSGATVPGLTFGFTGAIMVTIWLVVLFLFTPLSRSPFIYFQF